MTGSPESWQERYQAIERVYSERHWDDVARLSEALLLELPDDASHPLCQRLQLLLGHTYLYGYEDAATATGFYNRVRAATSEAVLRDIADQGLEQCGSQTAEQTPTAASEPSTAESSSAVAGQAFPFTPTPVAAGAGATEAVPAMPWMTQLGGTPAAEAVAPTPMATAIAAVDPAPELMIVSEPELVVEVVEEPELIDVAQADPARAEELEMAISSESTHEPAGRFSPEEIADLSKGLLRVVIR